MIRVEVIAGDAKVPFTFEKGEVRIGSREDNDIILAHHSVQEIHCILRTMHTGEVQVDTPGNRSTATDGEMIDVGEYRVVYYDKALPEEREQRFLDELTARPSDTDVSVIYADWLEEQGRLDHASYIRAQLAVVTADPNGEAFRRHKELIAAAATKLPLSWRSVVARAPIENCDLKFELQCPKQWAALQPTNDPERRFCNACSKYVHYAPSVDNARRLAVMGHCVAVDLGQPRAPGDLKPVPISRRTMGVVIRR